MENEICRVWKTHKNVNAKLLPQNLFMKAEEDNTLVYLVIQYSSKKYLFSYLKKALNFTK